MLIADLFLQCLKHFRVAIFALLLITPTRSLETPNGCLEVATALAKNSSMDALMEEPNFLQNAGKCLQGAIKLIGETDWKTVQAMMPPEITKFIHNVGLYVMANAKLYATGEGLVFMSVYLCYKGTELSVEAKHLALEHEKLQEEFDLLQQEMIQIKCFILDTDVVGKWKTSNTTQLVKTIEKLSKKLDRSSTILIELANKIRNNAKKCESGIGWSVFYVVVATGACAGSIGRRNLWLSAPVCIINVGTIISFFNTHTTCGETLRKSERLRQDAKNLRMEIAQYRAKIDIVIMKLEIVDYRTNTKLYLDKIE